MSLLKEAVDGARHLLVRLRVHADDGEVEVDGVDVVEARGDVDVPAALQAHDHLRLVAEGFEGEEAAADFDVRIELCIESRIARFAHVRLPVRFAAACGAQDTEQSCDPLHALTMGYVRSSAQRSFCDVSSLTLSAFAWPSGSFLIIQRGTRVALVRVMRPLSPLLLCLVLLLACGDDASAPDASTSDANTPDTNAPDVFDAGSADAGPGEDANMPDASAFDPDALIWEDVEEPAAGPLMLWGALVAHIDDTHALVFGGTTASRTNTTILDGTWLYTWEDGRLSAEEIESEGPAGRYCGCASYDPARNVVVLAGGRDFSPEITLDPETWELDLESREWTRIETTTTPIGGLGCNMTYVDGATHWFGGANAQAALGPRGSDGKTWRYDAGAAEWAELSIDGPSPRYDAHFVHESEESVLLFGGALNAGEGMNGDVWRFDGTTWALVTDNGAGPEGRRVAWVVPSPGGFIVAGGFDADMNTLGDMWRWNDGAWSELSEGAPERVAFTAVLPAGPDSLGVMMSGYDGDGPIRALRQLHAP